MAFPSIDDFYEKARIYHRFRIPNLRRFEDNGVIGSIAQLPFVYPDDRHDLLPLPGSYQSQDEEYKRQSRVRQAAYYEYETLHSTLERDETSRCADFEQFRARHEERTQRLVVRIANTDVPNPLQVFNFKVYRYLHGDPDVYLVGAKVKIADAFLKALGLGRPTWTVLYNKIDLKRFADEADSIVHGATFSKLRGRPRLSSASVYGSQVNLDPSWEEYNRIGELQHTIVQRSVENQDVNMMVTSRGSLMLYGIDDICDQLILVTEVYEQVVKRFETGIRRLT